MCISPICCIWMLGEMINAATVYRFLEKLHENSTHSYFLTDIEDICAPF